MTTDWMSINALSLIQWNTTAFDRLLLDEDKKDLILSFVRDHETMKPLTNDLIRGKGRHACIWRSAELQYWNFLAIILLTSTRPGPGRTTQRWVRDGQDAYG